MNVDDGVLVHAYLTRRDELSFHRLYQRCSPRLYLLALRLTGGHSQDAEDVLQEMWIRACARLPDFRGDSRLQTWLSGILVNCWRESRRRVQRNDGADALEELAVPAREMNDLESLIAALPQRCREVLVLHDIEGYTHEEIGAALGIAAGTSKHQLFRGRNRLREWLERSSHVAQR